MPRLNKIIFVGIMTSLFPLSSLAAISDNVCKALIKYGTYDSTDVFTDKDRYLQVRHAICSSQIETYEQAKASSGSLGIDIIDIISGSTSGGVTKDTFTQKKQEFCASSYSLSTSSDTLITSVRKASRTLSSAFVDCVSRNKGFTGWVQQSRNKKAFTIYLQYLTAGSQDFKITQISASPSKISCRGKEHLASERKPIKVSGSKLINCENLKPEESFMLAVSTDKGELLGPDNAGIELAGTAETISDLRDRVERLEGRSVPAGAIAYFNSVDCPAGWDSADEVIGRYIVGLHPTNRNDLAKVVGKPLSNLENRTIKHSHTSSDEDLLHKSHGPSDVGKGFAGLEWRHNGNVRFYKATRSSTEAGSQPNTNAPYVQLRACRKN